MMKTFCVQTLGCKVNHYEGEQLAALLRSHGLVEADASHADLRVVNTCSVTTEAAGKSRQATRRVVRLPLLTEANGQSCAADRAAHTAGAEPPMAVCSAQRPAARRPRVIVTGCWATSDAEAAKNIPGVDAVINHHADVAAELDRLLHQWRNEDADARRGGLARLPERLGLHTPAESPTEPTNSRDERKPERLRNDGWMTEAGTPAGSRTAESKAVSGEKVNLQIYALSNNAAPKIPAKISAGTTSLPLLGQRQPGRQRAFVKVQDGCDAHCTYCIIPRLRPRPWSKPLADVVAESRRLVAAGHVEIVLTGIFLSAYGHDTALRRKRDPAIRRDTKCTLPDTNFTLPDTNRASPETNRTFRETNHSSPEPLCALIDTLCTAVPGLRRLRLSSLEPGDLTPSLLASLRSHPQVVPHFHLPLQSGSDAVLRRMNRQYTRDDFLRMIDRVCSAFDRPALTTDVIVAFPGETDADFRRTLDVVDHAGFIHVHAFPFSPRPQTAAARWTNDFIPAPVAQERMRQLQSRADAFSLRFRQQFIGQTVELLVERDAHAPDPAAPLASPHGRSERYFDVHFDHPSARPGDFARVRVDRVTPQRTHGTCLSLERPIPSAAPGHAAR